MRITLDSNVLVRAHRFANGPAREVFQILCDVPSHGLVLSRYILDEVARALAYPRLRARYGLSEIDVRTYVGDLEAVSELIEPIIREPVVLTDPDDDPVLYTAADGGVDALCTLNTDFYRPNVLQFCQSRRIAVCNDVELLRALRESM